MATNYSVSEITAYIRDQFEQDETLQDLWVTGEISNFTAARSGHWYFSIKDKDAQLRCVMFKNAAIRQSIKPKDGDSVLVHGRISVYEARGEYQLYADAIQPMGSVGDLYRQFEELKAKLYDEGLFDEELKQPLPQFPQKIGVVTSPTTAAFQDMLNVLRRRYPLVEVILSPTLVQGNEAPKQIIKAIERLNQHTDIDVMIVSRGGGSIEDLWCFNDERVARAIAASEIPVISGVGHEIDFTIADFVADYRAPTPSAAAEVAVPDMSELSREVAGMAIQVQALMDSLLVGWQTNLDSHKKDLHRISPIRLIRDAQQRVDDLVNRLETAQRRQLNQTKERLTAKINALESANPEAILKRGYSIVTRSEDGQMVKSTEDAPIGTGVKIRIQDGELNARIEESETHERYKRTLF